MRLFKPLALALAIGASAPSLVLANNSHATSNEALVAARSHFFGAENVDQKTGAVDKDKVIISWFSVSSYAVAAKGRVFLLDTYIYRMADTPAYVPTTLQELVDLGPEAIFIGHGHFDHADNAAYISVKTGAPIFGAEEHCDAMRGDAERIFGAGTQVNCTSLVTAGSTPGAEVKALDFLQPDLCITSFKHLHSASAPPDPDLEPNPINAVRDPRVNDLYPPQPAPSLDTTTNAGAGGPVSMFYQFTVAGSDFSFIWHDTNGPIKELEPQLVDLLWSLPKADVEIGSLVSIAEFTNPDAGIRDPVLYIQNVKPKIFYGGHSDNFNIGASPYYHKAIQRQFEIMGIPEDERPEVRGLHDPYDYLRPGLATFEWKDKIWRNTPAGKTADRCEPRRVSWE